MFGIIKLATPQLEVFSYHYRTHRTHSYHTVKVLSVNKSLTSGKMPKPVTDLLAFNPSPRNKKLNKKLTYTDLEEYVKKKTRNTKAEPWEVFVDQANQSTIEGDEDDDKNKSTKTMRFYRMMSKKEADKTVKEKALQKNINGKEQYVTMSLKHSRDFQNSGNEGEYFVRFTVDVQKLAELPEFDPMNFLAVNTQAERTSANMINEQREAEGKRKLNYFETQKLGDHEYAKVNLGLWEESVKQFNSQLVAGEEVVVLVKAEDKKGKLVRVDSDSTQRSETSK